MGPLTAGLKHPFSLGLLLISGVVAAAIAIAGDSATRALFLLLWGLVAYAASSIVLMLRPRKQPAVAATSVQLDDDGLFHDTEESLKHLHDYGALASSGLLRRIPKTVAAAHANAIEPARGEPTHLEQAQALHTVLLRALERLKPAEDATRNSREALEYTVLYEEYVLRRPNNAIMTRLSVAERTFFRYRRAGIAAVARELASQERLLASAPPRPAEANRA